MEHDQPEAPTGLPYTGRVSEHGHPWEQPSDQAGTQSALPPVNQAPPVQQEPPALPAPAGIVIDAPPVGGSLRNTPVGEHGSLGGSTWEQRARRPIAFHHLVLAEVRKLLATTGERVALGIAGLLLIGMTWLAATQVNQTGPDGPVYRIFGLVLACQIAPVPLYAVVLRSVRADWFYRTAELTLVTRPGRLRLVAAQLVGLLPLWPVVALVQAGVYQLAQDGLGTAWVLAVALLGGLLSALFVLAIGLLVAHPVVAVVVYVVLSVLYVVRVRNPLVLRWIDPWQPASKLAGSVPELLPSVTSALFVLLVLTAGAVLASRR